MDVLRDLIHAGRSRIAVVPVTRQERAMHDHVGAATRPRDRGARVEAGIEACLDDRSYIRIRGIQCETEKRSMDTNAPGVPIQNLVRPFGNGPPVLAKCVNGDEILDLKVTLPLEHKLA